MAERRQASKQEREREMDIVTSARARAGEGAVPFLDCVEEEREGERERECHPGGINLLTPPPTALTGGKCRLSETCYALLSHYSRG